MTSQSYMAPVRSCWCALSELQRFSEFYLRCQKCGTLVYQGMAPEPRVIDDSNDFYGHQYWLEHQEEDLGLPNIVERALLDLPERCVYWTRHLLNYKLPPQRILEIGCAHGGGLALMRWAGFDAFGVELSPWVVNFAEKSFDVQVLQGPVEDLEPEANSVDAVCLFDVLEHLSDPFETLQRCREWMKPDAIWLVQTPEVPDNMDYFTMVNKNVGFLKHLHEEHIFLFSKNAVTQLFASLGYGAIHFLEPLFGYDMFFVACNTTLNVNTDQAISQVLSSTPSGRLIQAMLRLYEDRSSLRAELEKYRGKSGMATIPYIAKRSVKNFLRRCFYAVPGAHRLRRKH
jgi:2-polyprenyl-3-methyl-5-hydroxy-6-metoxy-1,4-benzoquinol methylase